MVLSATRSRSALAQLAFELITSKGDNLLLPSRSADAAAVWSAESAGYTLADLTFAQTTLSAFKSATLMKVTEELAQDCRCPLRRVHEPRARRSAGRLAGGCLLHRLGHWSAARDRQRLVAL